MNSRWLISALAFAAVLTAVAAQADSVNVLAGDASWHAFQTPATAGGTAFWNRSSYDGANHDCNIGYWLSGTGGCTANNGNFLVDSPNATPDYLGNTGTAWNMQKGANTQSVTVAARLQVTAYANSDEFGWYSASTPTVLNSLFVGAGIVQTSATFFPTGDYGFYLKSREGTYLTNGQGDTQTHFSVFRLNANGGFILGAEDMWNGGDWDYNDVVFAVTTSEVPEPASMLLLGTGLAALAGAGRRRRRP